MQVILFLVAAISCDSKEREKRLINEGNIIISKIKQFQKEQGRLPASLSEIGVEEKEESPLHYEKKSDTKYLLWFGTELGDSVVYDSEHKIWKGLVSKA